jgi:hypothetical protein
LVALQDQPGIARNCGTLDAYQLFTALPSVTHGSMDRILLQVGPWSDAIPFVNVAGYAVPIRCAD